MERIQLSVFGDVGDSSTKEGLRTFFDFLPEAQLCTLERVSPPPLQEPSVRWFPSEPRSHIARSTPLDAWIELIFRLVRFGHRHKVAKRGADGQEGEEELIELQNVKVQNVKVVIQVRMS